MIFMTSIEIYNMICMKKNSAICDLKCKQKIYAELPKDDPKNEIVARAIVELRAAIETYDDLLSQIDSNNPKSWDCCCGKEENNE